MRWNNLRYKSLPVILLAFLLMGAALFAERSGIKGESTATEIAYIQENVVTARKAAQKLPTTCLVLTDSTKEDSNIAMEQFQQIFLDMKIGYQIIDISRETVPEYKNFQTVVVLISELSSLKENLLDLCKWVQNGGRTLFALTIQKSSYSDLIEHKLGILSSGWGNVMVDSVYPKAEFMIGGGKKFPILEGYDSAWSVELDKDAIVHAYTGDEKKIPLVWENAYGDGKFVVVNMGICVKATRGFYAASYSLLEDVCVYPVINASMFYLDDFPSPVPGGDGKYIRRDYQMDVGAFYKNVWWPDMLQLAEKYNVKYTGVMIENYEDDTSENIKHNVDTADFQYFGNMLLHHGGELGYHGYNHQPLSLGNTDYGDILPYNTWETYKAMKGSVSELVDFGKEQFPIAEMAVYVPPSNVLSKEGRKMLGEEFPEIKTVASTYFDGECGYEQEFEVAEDGMVESPRVISGCVLNDYMRMVALSELNMHFINSHFLHPDDLLDVDRGAKIGWEKLKGNLDNYMEWLYQSAPSIRNLTGSEGAGAIQRYSTVTLEKEVKKDVIELKFNHFYDEAYFMIRMNEGTPGKVEGGSLDHVTGNLYLLHATEANVTIERTGE